MDTRIRNLTQILDRAVRGEFQTAAEALEALETLEAEELLAFFGVAPLEVPDPQPKAEAA